VSRPLLKFCASFFVFVSEMFVKFAKTMIILVNVFFLRISTYLFDLTLALPAFTTNLQYISERLLTQVIPRFGWAEMLWPTADNGSGQTGHL